MDDKIKQDILNISLNKEIQAYMLIHIENFLKKKKKYNKIEFLQEHKLDFVIRDYTFTSCFDSGNYRSSDIDGKKSKKILNEFHSFINDFTKYFNGLDNLKYQIICETGRTGGGFYGNHCRTMYHHILKEKLITKQ